MGLYLGSTDISGASFYLGSSEVSALYLGSTELYSAGGGQITTGLIYDYNYNTWDGGSTVTDNSDYSNNLTRVGTVSQGTDGAGGKYASFVNGGSYMYAQMSAGSKIPVEAGFTTPFTVEMVLYFTVSEKFHDHVGVWVSSDLAGNSSRAMIQNVWQYDTQVGGVGTGGILPAFPNYYAATNAPVYASTWYHLVYTYTSTPSNNKCYVNGTPYSVSFTDRLTAANWNTEGQGNITNYYMTVGGDAGNRNPKVRVATHRMYNVELNSSEVASQYAYWQSIGYTGL
jgi:hypothetical protein